MENWIIVNKINLKSDIMAWRAGKKSDSERSVKMFTTQEKEDALKIYEEVKLVRAVIQRLGTLHALADISPSSVLTLE